MDYPTGVRTLAEVTSVLAQFVADLRVLIAGAGDARVFKSVRDMIQCDSLWLSMASTLRASDRLEDEHCVAVVVKTVIQYAGTHMLNTQEIYRQSKLSPVCWNMMTRLLMLRAMTGRKCLISSANMAMLARCVFTFIPSNPMDKREFLQNIVMHSHTLIALSKAVKDDGVHLESGYFLVLLEQMQIATRLGSTTRDAHLFNAMLAPHVALLRSSMCDRRIAQAALLPVITAKAHTNTLNCIVQRAGMTGCPHAVVSTALLWTLDDIGCLPAEDLIADKINEVLGWRSNRAVSESVNQVYAFSPSTVKIQFSGSPVRCVSVAGKLEGPDKLDRETREELIVMAGRRLLNVRGEHPARHAVCSEGTVEVKEGDFFSQWCSGKLHYVHRTSTLFVFIEKFQGSVPAEVVHHVNHTANSAAVSRSLRMVVSGQMPLEKLVFAVAKLIECEPSCLIVRGDPVLDCYALRTNLSQLYAVPTCPASVLFKSSSLSDEAARIVQDFSKAMN